MTDPIDLLADAAADVSVPEPAADPVPLALTVAAARRSRRRWGAALAVVAAAALAAGLSPIDISAPIDTPEAVLRLPGGDRVTYQGHLEVDLADAPRRVVHLTEGDALFDVATGRGRFEVHTPDALVRVVGTVFEVAVRDGQTAVTVYEGRVDVEQGGRTIRLGEGERLGESDAARYAAVGEAAAEERRRHGHDAPARNEPTGEEPNASSLAASRVVPDPHHAPAQGPRPPESVAKPARVGRGTERRVPHREAPTLSAVRAMLAEGQGDEALAACDRALAVRPGSGDWLLLRGDALRLLGRNLDAAAVYDRAAEVLVPTRATGAGLQAAQLRLAAGDASGALDSLEAARASNAGSAVEERALVVEARARLSSGSDAAQIARRYLARFPGGTSRAWMATIVDGLAHSRPIVEEGLNAR